MYLISALSIWKNDKSQEKKIEVVTEKLLGVDIKLFIFEPKFALRAT